ncbi:hypothetical protein vseg_009442 [Gypsophila vaccaria]
MNISVNGESRIPPGFRFHPTEEELLQYYLRKKVNNDKIDLDVIFEVDLNKLEPWDIQEKCRIGTTPQNDWYFFSHKDKKYPTGTRTNRATVAGFWKATGRDKVIYSNCRRIGMRKTLVFYKGRAPHGQKSDWIMHEYRLDDTSNLNNDLHVTSHVMNNGEFTQEEGWVVCRIFKKKNHVKTLDNNLTNNNNNYNNYNNHNNNSSINTSNMSLIESHSTMLDSPSDNDLDHNNTNNNNNDQGALEQIFQSYNFIKFPPNNNNNNNKNIIISKPSFHNNDSINNTKFMKLPSLESPNNNSTTHQATFYHHPMHHENHVVSVTETDLGDWATLDRLVATHLNGHTTTDTTTMSSIFTSSSSNTIDDIHLQPLRSSPSSLSTSAGCKIYQNAPNNNINNNNNNSALENYGSNNNNNEIIDLWSFTRSTLQIDPLCHVADAGI